MFNLSQVTTWFFLVEMLEFKVALNMFFCVLNTSLFNILLDKHMNLMELCREFYCPNTFWATVYQALDTHTVLVSRISSLMVGICTWYYISFISLLICSYFACPLLKTEINNRNRWSVNYRYLTTKTFFIFMKLVFLFACIL